jgi:hypothetical protein
MGMKSSNIIWHLFAGESHQVVKVAVPYCATAFLRQGAACEHQLKLQHLT